MPYSPKSDQELIDQVKLALSILSRRHPPIYDAREVRLLGLEGYTPSADGDGLARIAAEEILLEVLLASLPDAPDVIDRYAITVDLLKEIENRGGTIWRKDIPPTSVLTDDFIQELEKTRILRRGDGGLSWGSAAKQFIEDFEKENQK